MSKLRLFIAVTGGVLMASGAITAYADTLGAGRWVSIVLGGLGTAQLVAADVMQSVEKPNG